MHPLIETPGYNRDRAIRALVYDEATKHHALDDLAAISETLKDAQGFVWLDIAQPSEEDLELLQNEFTIHPKAIENAMLGDDRPKIEFYGDHVLVVADAATLDLEGNLVTHEIAFIASSRYVITLRGYPVYPLADIEARRDALPEIPNDATGLLYVLLDAIVDGYETIADRYDSRLAHIESQLFDTDSVEVRTEREIFRFKRTLTLFRSVLVPTRDVLLRLTRPPLAPLAPELGLYFRDAHDHIVRIIEQVDIARELINSTFDIHLATQSHRQNEVTKQLTVIATIFLPLTYITGFFGMNFGYMVNGITSPEIFFYLGLGSQVLTVAFLFYYFRRRRWF